MKLLKQASMNVHLMGICGSGMSALAKILKSLGHSVTGCDPKAKTKEEFFLKSGIEIFDCHHVSHVMRQDLIVYSSAVPASDLECLEAKRLQIPVVQRSMLLSELMSSKKSIAISGMHGKTSTTGMMAKILLEAEWDPTIVVGGDFDFLSGNARWGKGEWSVFEADESDGTLLQYHPEFAVITNLDSEHLDFFKNFENILNHFKSFSSQVRKKIVINGDDSGCQSFMKSTGLKDLFLTFGFSPQAQLRATDIEHSHWGSTFGVVFEGEKLGQCKLNIPGLHQISNALAAIGTALLLKIGFNVIQQALFHFKGASRRLEILGQINQTTFIDDYAHHPTEIEAVLSTIKNNFKGKVLTIFQPHRYTRTNFLKKELAQALVLSDHIIVTDIYSSSEVQIPGVTGLMLVDLIKNLGHSHVFYFASEKQSINNHSLEKSSVSHSTGLHKSIYTNEGPSETFKEISKYIQDHISEYDVILTMGAGDITSLGRDFLEKNKLNHKDEKKKDILEFYKQNPIKGKILNSEPMSRHTTFRLGGPADFWVEPVDLEDLLEVQQFARQKGLPILVVGNGSNMIVRDGGIRGIVIRLSNPYFRRMKIEDNFLTVGSGLSLAEVIQRAVENGLSGLENLKGIPGTIGGALHFNAGAYGTEIGERLYSVLALNPDGSLEVFSKEKLGLNYRSCEALKGKIALEAKFLLKKTQARELSKRVFELKVERSMRYPKLPNAGCIFKNPEDNFAGQLIDEAGFKDFSVGDAQISSQHANFIVNKGKAKASDVLTLIEKVRQKIYQSKNIFLENEVEVFGEDE